MEGGSRGKGSWGVPDDLRAKDRTSEQRDFEMHELERLLVENRVDPRTRQKILQATRCFLSGDVSIFYPLEVSGGREYVSDFLHMFEHDPGRSITDTTDSERKMGVQISAFELILSSRTGVLKSRTSSVNKCSWSDSPSFRTNLTKRKSIMCLVNNYVSAHAPTIHGSIDIDLATRPPNLALGNCPFCCWSRKWARVSGSRSKTSVLFHEIFHPILHERMTSFSGCTAVNPAAADRYRRPRRA